MRYQDFVLKIDAGPDGTWSAVVLESPAGGKAGKLELPLQPGEIRELRRGAHRSEIPENEGGELTEDVRDLRREASSRGDLASVGEILFRALFHGPVYGLLERSLGQVEKDPEAGLLIRLVFDLEDPAVAEIAALPWELLYWKERREFLCLSRKNPVVRSLLIPRPLRPRSEGPLRVLAVASNLAQRPLHLEKEIEALKAIEGIEVRFLDRPTPDALHARLLQEEFDVFHFLGHGQLDPRSGQGSLWLQDDRGKPFPLSGQALADIFRNAPSLRLAFLNACKTARTGEGKDPFLGTAAALAMAGLPAVLAMREPVSDSVAIRFSKTVYERLAAGDSIESAVVTGRLSVRLHETGSMEWATPVLLMHRSEDRLQGSPALLSPPGGLRRNVIDRSALIREKTQDFVGRRWVFETIDRFAEKHPEGGFFLLLGDPGIGKSALVARMTTKYRAVHHFNIQADGLNSPEIFLANVCAQLSEQLSLGMPALPSEATRDGRFLTGLLEKLSKRLAPGERAFLLVDALDEARSDNLPSNVNPLYLPTLLPPGLFMIGSMRNDGPYVRFDGARDKLAIDQGSSDNQADIREFLEGRLERAGIRAYLAGRKLDGAAFVDEMAKRSEGNFMYLRFVVPEIESGFYKDHELSTLPVGLEGYYDDHWIRMKKRGEDWLPVLAALTVLDEPLPFDLIVELSEVKDRRRVRAILNDWKAFIISSPSRGETFPPEEPLFRVYHQSFRDFIRRKDEVADERVDLQGAAGKIADFMLRRLDGEI